MIRENIIQSLFESFAEIQQDITASLARIAIKVDAPILDVVEREVIEKKMTSRGVLVAASFSAPCPGMCLTFFPLPLGIVIPEHIINPDSKNAPEQFTDLHASAMKEICETVWTAANEKFTRAMNRKFVSETTGVFFETPSDYISNVPALTGIGDFLRVQYPVEARNANFGMIVQLFPTEFIERAIPECVVSDEAEPESSPDRAWPVKEDASRKEMKSFRAKPVGAAPAHTKTPDKRKEEKPETGTITCTSGAQRVRRNLNTLLGIPIEVVAELGRAKMTAENVVKISPGTIVKLDAFSDQPIRVMVNGRLVARAEVVSIKDTFGFRVTEIVEPEVGLRES